MSEWGVDDCPESSHAGCGSWAWIGIFLFFYGVVWGSLGLKPNCERLQVCGGLHGLEPLLGDTGLYWVRGHRFYLTAENAKTAKKAGVDQ